MKRLDLLSDILSKLRLAGTLYFRTSFTSPWSVRVPDYENVARFHVVHRGRCLLRVMPDEDPVQLEQGDLIIIPRGAAHTLYCDPENEHSAVTVDQVVKESGFTGRGTLVYGNPGSNHETQLVCGHFAFDDSVRHPLMNALPDYIHVKDYGTASGSWMESTLKVIGAEAGRDNLGSDLIALKMSEIVFAQALRAYVDSAGADQPVLAAFSDQRIARALQAIHDNAGFPWTLEELAKIAGLSRTAFTTTFTRYLSTTPFSYITDWRMLIAKQLLTESKDPIIRIAEQTGYQSEAAFSRVFKRHFDTGPATYRRENQLSTG